MKIYNKFFLSLFPTLLFGATISPTQSLWAMITENESLNTDPRITKLVELVSSYSFYSAKQMWEYVEMIGKVKLETASLPQALKILDADPQKNFNITSEDLRNYEYYRIESLYNFAINNIEHSVILDNQAKLNLQEKAINRITTCMSKFEAFNNDTPQRDPQIIHPQIIHQRAFLHYWLGRLYNSYSHTYRDGEGITKENLKFFLSESIKNLEISIKEFVRTNKKEFKPGPNQWLYYLFLIQGTLNSSYCMQGSQEEDPKLKQSYFSKAKKVCNSLDKIYQENKQTAGEIKYIEVLLKNAKLLRERAVSKTAEKKYINKVLDSSRNTNQPKLEHAFNKRAVNEQIETIELIQESTSAGLQCSADFKSVVKTKRLRLRQDLNDLKNVEKDNSLNDANMGARIEKIIGKARDIEQNIAKKLGISSENNNLEKLETLKKIYNVYKNICDKEAQALEDLFNYVASFIKAGYLDEAIKRTEVIMDLSKENKEFSSMARILHATIKNFMGDYQEWEDLAKKANEIRENNEKKKENKNRRKRLGRANIIQQSIEAERLSQANITTEVAKQEKPKTQNKVMAQKSEAPSLELTPFYNVTTTTTTSEEERRAQRERHEENEAKRANEKANQKAAKKEVTKFISVKPEKQELNRDELLNEMVIKNARKPLADLYELKEGSTAEKVDSQIVGNSWKFTRQELYAYLEAMGCKYSQHATSHMRITLPEYSSFKRGNDSIFIDTDLSKTDLVRASFGGALTLPRWENVVPHYLRKQILKGRERLRLQKEIAIKKAQTSQDQTIE